MLFRFNPKLVFIFNDFVFLHSNNFPRNGEISFASPESASTNVPPLRTQFIKALTCCSSRVCRSTLLTTKTSSQSSPRTSTGSSFLERYVTFVSAPSIYPSFSLLPQQIPVYISSSLRSRSSQISPVYITCCLPCNNVTSKMSLSVPTGIYIRIVRLSPP